MPVIANSGLFLPRHTRNTVETFITSNSRTVSSLVKPGGGRVLGWLSTVCDSGKKHEALLS